MATRLGRGPEAATMLGGGAGLTLGGDCDDRLRNKLAANPGWLAATVVSLVGLGLLAPSGLYLIGFLGVIIITHEVGHFVVARRSGMVPTELFWGFGPEVVAVRIGGCRYGIKALFLGGYVKLEGLTPTSVVPDGFAEPGTYRAASHRGRLATILAGPTVNLVTAFVA
ncbi:MAG: site-2 protease family protein, partial [Acidimicrobiales bacterium]